MSEVEATLRLMTRAQTKRESSSEGDSRSRAPLMASFSPAAQRWFAASFSAPTPAQKQAWEAIGSRKNVLVVAPTGSGKTLAAFLWALDRLAAAPPADPGVRVLYVSPMKALGVDVERNLRAPLSGLREASRALGLDEPKITVGVRSGDTTPSERRRLLAHPPDILITTPESLYLMLTSKGAETLRSVETVIVDEVHALAGNKRGAHLALSLERLDALLGHPAQRIGLSATVEPVGEVARFLGGSLPVEVVRPPSEKTFDIVVEVPAADMTEPPIPEPEMVNANSSSDEHRLGSMWPSIERSLYERILGARSTIVFTNSRRQAERLTGRLNELHAARLEDELGRESETLEATPLSHAPGEDADRPAQGANSADPGGEEGLILARAHHGSVSKEARARVEEDLKSGRLRCVVATASLELGIDMGEVDLVVQIDPPPSVSSGLQRLGRSGHQVGGASSAVFYPTHRSKLLETAVIVQRMRAGEIETLRVVSNPLDVLAQQTIAEAVSGPLGVDEWYSTVRRSAPFRDLPRAAYTAVLDLISGKYPSTEFASLRARVDWDRTDNILHARPGALRLAVTNGGTIPDRGLYRVVVGSEEGGSTRVGELDEEMVYETRVGEVFTLGTTSWRVRQITRDTVEVEPAFGVVARTPFWRGDSPSRPVEVGRAIEKLTEQLSASPAVGSNRDGDADGPHELLREVGFDQFAADNALAYLREQEEAAGRVPNSSTFVVERTRDDVGDWLLILESPLGLAVHAPWALAINARLRDEWGLEGKTIPSNDGLVVRLPDFEDADDGPLDPELVALLRRDGPRSGGESARMPTATEIFAFDPEEIVEIVRKEVENSAVFAARFREASARALILGASKPGKRSPLWQQRLRASSLLEVACKYPDFPMILEALREVLQDVYDVDALREAMASLGRRQRTLVEVTTDVPSPFARSLLFGYVGEFMYSGDVPIGERRIAALSVDPQVLRELLGEVPLSELLEDRAVQEVESELQRTKPGWQARGADGLVDLLRALGPLTTAEISSRLLPDSGSPTESGNADGAHTGEDDRFDASTDFGALAATLDAGEELLEPSVGGLIDRAVAARRAVPIRMGGQEYLAAVEDVGLLVAAAGVVPPPGVAASFLETPAAPVRELLVRHLNSNAPFTADEVAARFGIAVPTLVSALRGIEDSGDALRGRFLPEENAQRRGLDPAQEQWVGTRVLDRIRSRSLSLLRGSVEPVPATAFAQFLASWQFCDGRLRGVDGLYTCLEQLERFPLPASTWETLVLPTRVGDYQPAMLDTLVSNGEISWVGAGSIGGRDGWVEFVPAGLASRAPLLPDRQKSAVEEAILDELHSRGALFASALLEGLTDRGLTVSTGELTESVWALVWDGLITSDSIAALRARIGGTKAAQKTARVRPRGRSLARVGMTGHRNRAATAAPSDPSLVGRWSLVTPEGIESDNGQDSGPDLSSDEATVWAVEMLERYGVVTRGSVVASDFPGGFSQAYRLYSDFEVSGTCRRGYFVEGLGGTQFAIPGAVDQLRATEQEQQRSCSDPTSLTVAATDPANPYGASLSWPATFSGQGGAKRKPGALITLVGGSPVLYLERGGKTLLGDPDATVSVQRSAVESLVETVRRGDLATFTVERINGEAALGSSWREALVDAGFAEVPRGLTLRRRIH